MTAQFTLRLAKVEGMSIFYIETVTIMKAEISMGEICQTQLGPKKHGSTINLDHLPDTTVYSYWHVVWVLWICAYFIYLRCRFWHPTRCHEKKSTKPWVITAKAMRKLHYRVYVYIYKYTSWNTNTVDDQSQYAQNGSEWTFFTNSFPQ